MNKALAKQILVVTKSILLGLFRNLDQGIFKIELTKLQIIEEGLYEPLNQFS